MRFIWANAKVFVSITWLTASISTVISWSKFFTHESNHFIFILKTTVFEVILFIVFVNRILSLLCWANSLGLWLFNLYLCKIFFSFITFFEFLFVSFIFICFFSLIIDEVRRSFTFGLCFDVSVRRRLWRQGWNWIIVVFRKVLEGGFSLYFFVTCVKVEEGIMVVARISFNFYEESVFFI